MTNVIPHPCNTKRSGFSDSQVAPEDIQDPATLITAGKRLRTTVPRALHGPWVKSSDRFDPIALLQATDDERIPELVPVRYGRMLASPFAFYRGSAEIMAADLAKTPSTGLRVQVCGDCHLMNFGGFATPERNVIFDMNDFDETLPAPWEWDVKRLVASMVLAARSIGLKDHDGREAAMATSRSYRKRLAQYAHMSPLEVCYAHIHSDDFLNLFTNNARRTLRTRRRLRKAIDDPPSEKDFPALAGVVAGQVHIKDAPPLIFHPDITHAPEFMETFETAFATYRDTLPEDRRRLLDRYRPVDAAIKVVGIGSVGRRCWIGLLMSAANDPLFLQVKEARASVLEPYAGASAYTNHGQRVVMGQRLMQPASDVLLGWMQGLEGRHLYVRQFVTRRSSRL